MSSIPLRKRLLTIQNQRALSRPQRHVFHIEAHFRRKLRQLERIHLFESSILNLHGLSKYQTPLQTVSARAELVRLLNFICASWKNPKGQVICVLWWRLKTTGWFQRWGWAISSFLFDWPRCTVLYNYYPYTLTQLNALLNTMQD